MTPEKLKQFLAPDTFICLFCKGIYTTDYAALRCQAKDEKAFQMLEDARKKREADEKKSSEGLKKMLEDNLT